MGDDRILIVDDESIICYALTQELEREGYKADHATSGEEALDSIRKNDYSIIFVDFVMPGVDGIKVCKEVKKIRPEAIVVFMTGRADKSTIYDEMDFMERGGEIACLHKPFFENEIVDTVKELLKNK